MEKLMLHDFKIFRFVLGHSQQHKSQFDLSALKKVHFLTFSLKVCFYADKSAIHILRKTFFLSSMLVLCHISRCLLSGRETVHFSWY